MLRPWSSRAPPTSVLHTNEPCDRGAFDAARDVDAAGDVHGDSVPEDVPGTPGVRDPAHGTRRVDPHDEHVEESRGGGVQHDVPKCCRTTVEESRQENRGGITVKCDASTIFVVVPAHEHLP
eukprot:1183900-Prorocentrum_minimum.AAC.9